MSHLILTQRGAIPLPTGTATHGSGGCSSSTSVPAQIAYQEIGRSTSGPQRSAEPLDANFRRRGHLWLFGQVTRSAAACRRRSWQTALLYSCTVRRSVGLEHWLYTRTCVCVAKRLGSPRLNVVNPVILGAIIGAVPGTAAATLSTWAALRAGKMNLSQTQLTLATEHQQWLRNKRSEVYVDLLTYAEQLFTRRQKVVHSLSDITDDNRCEVQAILDEYGKLESKALVARADTYASSDTAEMFGGMVYLMDFAFWAVVHAKIVDPSSPQFEIDTDVKKIWAYADEGLKALRKLAYRELQTALSLNSPVRPPSSGTQRE